MTSNKRSVFPACSAKTGGIISLAVLLSAICAVIAVLLWQQDSTVTEENRIIENTQIAFLGLASLLHSGIALKTLPAPTRCLRRVTAIQICHAVLAMLCVSIMVRELDIDKFGPEPWWETWENAIRLIGIGIWLVLWVHIFRHLGNLWHWKARILTSSTSMLTGIGVLFYMASWFFDKSVVPLTPDVSQLWEETLQMSGTIFLFTGALRTIRLDAPRTDQCTLAVRR